MNAYTHYQPHAAALPMPLTNVDQSGYNWFKFSHVEFLLNPKMAVLKLDQQGALLRLMSHAARQTPFASLPNDPETLAAMVGVSLPRWAKMADGVMAAGFTLCNDDRFYCALMANELGKQGAGQAQPEAMPEAKKKTTSAERVAKMRERNRNAVTHDVTHDVTPDSVTCNTGVTHVTPDSVTCNTESVTFGGIKGGDLDQDLDLDLEKNKKTKTAFFEKNESAIEKPEPAFDPDDLPNLEQLNYQLKAGGAEPVTIDFVKSQLFEFQSHFSGQHLSHFQVMGKWVGWIKRGQNKAKADAARLQRMASSGQNSGQNTGKGGFVDYANTGARQTETPAPIAHIAALSGIELMAFKRLKEAMPEVTEHGIAAQAKAENVDLLVFMNKLLQQDLF